MKVDRNPVLRLGRESPGFSHYIRRARVAAIAGLSLAAGLFAHGNAVAQTVVTPPPLPYEVTVFPQRDFVHIAGYVNNSDLLVKLKRGTTTVTANAKIVFDLKANSWGADVNHAGGFCWNNVTPIIAANDVIEVTYDPASVNNQALVAQGLLPATMLGSGYSTRTASVTATRAYIDNTNPLSPVVVVKGRALTGNNPTPLARVEVAIRNKAFKSDPNARLKSQDLRATNVAGGNINDPRKGAPANTNVRGFLAADTATCVGCFIARFTGLNATELALAVQPYPNAVASASAWQAAAADGTALGMTIYEVDEIHGPGDATCPPGPNGPIPPNPPAAPVAYDVLNLTDSKLPPADLTALHANNAVFPSRDFVSVDGYPLGAELQFVVRRWDAYNGKDMIVGTARGTTSPSDPATLGILEANHPGGVCWSGQTPDIKAGDKVDVYQIVNGAYSQLPYKGETQEVIGVSVTGKYVDADGKLVITGTMPLGWDLTLMEQRIIQPGFLNRTTGSRIGKRDIRADTTGGRVLDDNANPIGTGFLEETSPTTWKATYTGLNAAELQLAYDGESRIMAWWSADANGNRYGMTIYEYNVPGGPGIGGCPSTGSFLIAVPPYPPAP